MEGTVRYVEAFGGTAETFETARIHNNSAAHVVMCSYEHAEKVLDCVSNRGMHWLALDTLAGNTINSKS